MNKLLILAAAALSLSACNNSSSSSSTASTTATETDSNSPAAKLIAQLRHIQQDSCFLFGHHDDTAYGFTWNNIGVTEHNDLDTTGRSDVKDIVDDYPGLINWDLGMLELDSTKNLDDVPFDRIRKEIIKQHKRGGFNAISFHPRNPMTLENAWDTTSVGKNSDGSVIKNLMHDIATEGTEMNARLRSWAGKTADFIASLKDENGNPIPVVYRPWHEHTGSWFWWGAELSAPADYKALWHLTRDEFNKRGINNVVWCYSPDRCVDGIEQYLERYPGDEYVDIMGADVYYFGMEEGAPYYADHVAKTLTAATQYAKEHNKLVAFSETGHETVPLADWYDQKLLPLCKQFPISYVCVWRNAPTWMKPDHFYAPYKGHKSEQSFVNFYNDKSTLFCKEAAKY